MKKITVTTKQIFEDVEDMMAMFPPYAGKMLVQLRGAASRGNKNAKELLRRIESAHQE